jgi:ABC-type transport system substrate-binding protein
MKRFKHATARRPFLKRLSYYVYPSSDEYVQAYRNGTLDVLRIPFQNEGLEITPSATMTTTTLTGIFVSRTSESPLQDNNVVQAIGQLIDRAQIVQEVYAGLAEPTQSILPLSLSKDEQAMGETDPQVGLDMLAEAGWTFDSASGTMVPSSETSGVASPLSFTLATVNAPHLVAAAENIREQLANYGIDVTIDIYTSEALYNDVVPNRSFDALLFGLGIETPASLRVFWHSRHRRAFNITEYTNSTTDDLLDRAHTEFDPVLRASLYHEFDARLREDAQAIMLYSQTLGLASRNTTVSVPHFGDHRSNQYDRIDEWFKYGTAVWRGITPRRANLSL